MPQGVVDTLEAVEVQEHEGSRLTTPATPADYVIQTVPEQLPVREAGKRIIECQPVQLGLGGLELGQISQAKHNAIDAWHRQHGCKGALHIPPLPLGITDTDPDDRHLFARRLNGIVKASLQLGPVVTMNELLKVQGLNLIRLEAKDIQAGRARVQGLPGTVHHQGDIGCAFGNRPIAAGTDLRHQP